MGLLLKIFQILGAKFTKDVIVFTVFKAFITSLILVSFPIALSVALTTLYSGVHERVLSFANDSIDASGSGNFQSVLIHVTGLTAFFVNHLNLIQSFNLIISAIALRIVLNFIPFLKI